MAPSGGRETAGVTTALILRYAAARGGDSAVAEVTSRAGLDGAAPKLLDEASWWTYAEKIALFAAAAEVLDDEQVARHVGETVLDQRVGHSVKLLLRALGSPAQVLREVARTASKFSTVCTMEALEVGRREAVVTYRLHDGHIPNRMDCDYNIGLLSQVSLLFGLPPATVTHPECQVDGADRCTYKVTWTQQSRRPGKARAQRIAYLEDQLATIGERTESLQSTIADLVSPQTLGAILARITTRAATTVRAQAFVLALHPRDDARLEVHHEGLDDDTARAIAEALLEGGATPGWTRLVADIESSRRHYGRLAALYREGHDFFPEEQLLLSTYARHAAIALDAATALHKARERERTATLLLRLARELSEATDSESVAQRLADAVPALVDAQRAVVYLYDSETKTLFARATNGYPEEVAETLKGLVFSPEDTPFFEEIETDPEPRHYRAATETDPLVKRYMEAYGAAETFVVPIRSHGRLLGLVTATQPTGAEPLVVDSSLKERLTGLADEAALAFEKVRLLEGERATIEALREADRFKAEFLSMVSHELRTPLTAIVGTSRTLSERAELLDDATRDELIASISRRGEQLERLVADLLQASRNIELEIVRSDLAVVARRAAEDAERLNPQVSVVFEGAEPAPALADPNRVSQVLDNLITNAIKYASEGTIRVGARRRRDKIELWVADEGPGMTSDLLRRVFEPFVQGGADTESSRRGVGLGLYISRRIAEAHGGSLQLESEPGRGTTATLTLPMSGPR